MDIHLNEKSSEWLVKMASEQGVEAGIIVELLMEWYIDYCESEK